MIKVLILLAAPLIEDLSSMGLIIYCKIFQLEIGVIYCKFCYSKLWHGPNKISSQVVSVQGIILAGNNATGKGQ